MSRSMGARIRLFLVLVVFALAVAQPSFAESDKPDRPKGHIGNDVGERGPDGSKVIPAAAPLDEKQQRLLIRKQDLAAKHAGVKQGKSDGKALEKEYENLLEDLGERPSQAATSTSATPRNQRQILWANTSYRALGLNQVAQTKSNYCGPASAYSILGALGYSRSYDGESLSQSVLATRKYLETDYWGNTPWYTGWSYPYAETLNYWRTGSYSGYYLSVGTSVDAQRFKDNFTFDIDYSWPVAGNAWEDPTPAEPHLVGHPTNIEIFHWVEVYGYDNWGDTVLYADPVSGASSISWSGNVPRYSRLSTTSFARILNGRGYVW